MRFKSVRKEWILDQVEDDSARGHWKLSGLGHGMILPCRRVFTINCKTNPVRVSVPQVRVFYTAASYAHLVLFRTAPNTQ